jgi:hypothetical protein
VTVMDSIGKRLKIPIWMLASTSADVSIIERPLLSKEALLSLTSVLATILPYANKVRDNLLQMVVDEHKGGQHGATSASGTDPKGERGRAHEQRGAKRTDRSHGPHSGGGV